MNINLAKKLREGTTKSHSMAENVNFVKSFLGGVVDKKSYRKLLANLYFIYSALEEEIENNKDYKAIQMIYFPQLHRKASLEEDLIYYYDHDWKSKIAASSATQVYVNRIHSIGRSQPELLIAHAYTRYMGDLSGGQILKKIAKRAMQLEENQGTNFYIFKSIDDDNKFKQMYRTALDNVPIGKETVDQIISEANIAFHLNMKVFQELNSNIIKIMVMLLTSNISSFLKSKTVFDINLIFYT
uniref:Heme oxygenase n=1 Tax=Sporolithon durum TaxID=48970 RepID=A0A141SCR5_9FLOR|nr:heme oxygenase [Sporolithon durum]AMK96083.1 heme oxygenase [Sporolithon durum]